MSDDHATTDDLDPDLTARQIAGEHLGEDDEEEKKASVATQLVRLTLEHYTVGQTPEGEAFALPKTGVPLVRQLRGGRDSLRNEIAKRYFGQTGKVASQSALADALAVIEGYASDEEQTPLHLRVAEHQGAQVLDLGDAEGRAVVVRPGGWEVVARPPVLFRRTALTGALPAPERGGSLDELWALLNVAPEYRPVLAAVLVAALLPGIPHPITALTGEQGTGKTSAAKMIGATLDPSPAQVRKAPRDVEQWTTAVSGSWLAVLDNLSGVPEWLSDALCRASTGDGDVRRRLYSDSDLHVLAFKRVVILTGITLGDLADDLADRLVTVGLERIGDDRRLLDADLTAAWERAHPRVLGALLDLAAGALEQLPAVHLDEMPRMADFARVLRAVDLVLGTDGLTTYLKLRDELAEDAFAGDEVLSAIERVISGRMDVTASRLLELLNEQLKVDEQRPPKGWPTKARDITTKLTRSGPAMRRLGWTVEDAGKDSTSRAKKWRLEKPSSGGQQREGGDDARNARDARTETVIPGQTTSSDPSDRSSDTSNARANRSGPRAIPSDSLGSDGRRSGGHSTQRDALTSTNGPEPSDTSEPSDDPALSRAPDAWRGGAQAVRSA